MQVRELLESDRPWASTLVAEHFGSPRVVSRGRVHDTRAFPGLVAEIDGASAGLLQYRVHDRQCEILVLIAVKPRAGAGRRLLEAVAQVAQAHGCRRPWLVTTNDNRGAIAFYRSVGWRQVAVHRGAVREARRLKPEIPERGEGGVPIEDEVELEIRV
jgi:ribosomal protein S18 acetylase RimI-like enzyme